MILLDLKHKGGRQEVLRRVKSDEGRMIPVVVLCHQEDKLIESYNLGVNSYITKPVSGKVSAGSMRSGVWLLLNKQPY